MTEKRTVNEVLPPDAVQPVATPGERLLRILFENDRSFVGILILAIAVIASLVLLFTDKLYYQGFQLLNSLASGAAGYFFATRGRRE